MFSFEQRWLLHGAWVLGGIQRQLSTGLGWAISSLSNTHPSSPGPNPTYQDTAPLIYNIPKEMPGKETLQQ